MLFNSYEFIGVYLPVVFLGFFLIARLNQRAAALWLAIASLVFYGWWNPRFVALLLASVAFNFMAGRRLARQPQSPAAYRLLFFAVSANLGLLGVFKYFNFFITTVDALAGTHWSAVQIVLPLGISFFTFTQIAYLVDVYRGLVKEYDPILYLLFVTYFPHLIAGPILHHKQMMPQFAARSTYRPQLHAIATGLTIFSIGLAKKVLLADEFSQFVSPIFDAARHGQEPQVFEAWVGAITYTFQLYFDFSGYSDMAIGLSRLFGVQLPVNFDSPYKSRNIIEFWRRWHISLSTFLRDYLYIPLGGNRKGAGRRYVNLFLTMLLGGLWHGASWTFVAWGALHGVYLIINHLWQRRPGWNIAAMTAGPFITLLNGSLTFLAVVTGWVLFRADSFSSAFRILRGMYGFNGLALPRNLAPLAASLPAIVQPHVQFIGVIPSERLAALAGGTPLTGIVCLVIGSYVIWGCPNTQQMVGYASAAISCRIDESRERRPLRYALLGGMLLAVSLLSLTKVSTFLYYQF